jgi:hypothetical protein
MGHLILLGAAIVCFIVGAVVAVFEIHCYPGDIFAITMLCLLLFGLIYQEDVIGRKGRKRKIQ